MVVEILNHPHRLKVSVHQLREKLAILKEEWTKVEVYENETLYSPFEVLTEQVKREIRECGFAIDESPNVSSVERMGDNRVGLCLMYCSPRVLVVIHFNHESLNFNDGDQDVRTTLAGIQVMELD
jgi:hypothetical protein